MVGLVIPQEILDKADIAANDLLVEIAVYLYDKERLSFGQAKTLAGLNYLSFQKELSKRDVYIKYDVEDFEQDLATLEELRNKQDSGNS